MFTFSGYEYPAFSLATLGQFQVTDPFFDANEFLSFATGAYLKIHHAVATADYAPVRNLLSESMLMQLQSAPGDQRWSVPIERVVNASVLSVQHDNNVDTVTVRIASQTTAKKKNELTEDWMFTRPAANWGGMSAPPVTQCPSCGAPAELDEHGACRYCRVPIKGVAGDWRLIGTQTVEVQKATTSSGCSWSGFWIFIIVTTIVLPLAITGAILWFVRDTTNNTFNSFGDIFPSTTLNARTPSSPPTLIKQGAMRGTLAMTSGLSGGGQADDVAFVGADSGPCVERAKVATGVTAHTTGDQDGLHQDVTITVHLPAGQSGPGTYPEATATVVLTETPIAGQAQTAAAENNSWTGPATVTIASNTGTLTMKDLAPADPKWSKFSGTVTYNCAG